MRLTHALTLVLLLVPTAVAEEKGKPPSEKAAFAATRNLLHALAGAKEAGRQDAFVRYVDDAAFASRTFGEKYDSLSEDEREKVRAPLREFVAIGLYDKMPRPDDPDAASLGSQQVEGVFRMVTYKEGKETVQLLWAVANPAPMLVDLGNPRDGFFSKFARDMWSQGGGTPAAFLVELLAKIGDRTKAAKKPTEKPVPKNRFALIVKSKDNIRSMITLMIARRTERTTGGYPPYSGKNFVLSLVATNQLDRRNDQNMEILFSPGDKNLSLEKADKKLYKEINKKALKRGDDFSTLTSYAGRRNADMEFLITPSQEKMGTPMIADLSFPDVAIVGFSNGAVREMTRKELGLEKDDPIAVGDESKSVLLQKLSDQ